MAHILALSSWVAHGHVGLSAGVPVMQRLGHQVTQLPTVHLSNHPGFSAVAGGATDPDTLRAMTDALDRNGWLTTVDTILTGYLPSAAHVDFACDLIGRFARPGPRIVVDPVLGDRHKGLYIAEDAARAMRDRLVGLADILTPNAFELSWLTDCDVASVAAVCRAAGRLSGTRADRARPGDVLVTSAPFGGADTGVLSVTATGTVAFRAPRTHRDDLVPHGVGDVFSALIAAGCPPGEALGQLQCLIGASLGAPHLRIAETAAQWTAAAPIHGTAIDPLTGPAETR